MLVPDEFTRKFGIMSPYAFKEFDIALEVEEAIKEKSIKRVGVVTSPTQLEKASSYLESKFSMTIHEIVSIVARDIHTLKVLKKAWYNPEYQMDYFDELVFEKVMENELGRS